MRTTILSLILLLPGVSWAASGQTTAEQIDGAVSRFLENFAAEQAESGYQVSYEAGDLDNRLTLAPCKAPLAVEFTGDPWKSTRPSLQVSCEGKRPWRMYVSPNVYIQGPALVAARPLARGEVLDSSMVTNREVQINASRRGYIRDIANAEGMAVRRPISSGSLLTPDLLDAPIAVKRGDHVMIVARSGTFSVSSRGEALANASVGEQVQVRNLRSDRTIRASVVAPGKVEIPM